MPYRNDQTPETLEALKNFPTEWNGIKFDGKSLLNSNLIQARNDLLWGGPGGTDTFAVTLALSVPLTTSTPTAPGKKPALVPVVNVPSASIVPASAVDFQVIVVSGIWFPNSSSTSIWKDWVLPISSKVSLG